MSDSTDTNITYTAIKRRAMQDAQERMPDLPTQGDVESWESFIADLEDLDTYQIAYESTDWDWVIYYYRAMQVCSAVPTSVLHQAESEWHDMGLADSIDSGFGLYEMACQLASIIVTREIVDAIEALKEELVDLAQTAIDNQ